MSAILGLAMEMGPDLVGFGNVPSLLTLRVQVCAKSCDKDRITVWKGSHFGWQPLRPLFS